MKIGYINLFVGFLPLLQNKAFFLPLPTLSLGIYHVCQHLPSVSHEIRESQIHLKTTQSCFLSINRMVNVPVRAGEKGVDHTMMGKSTSLPAGSDIKRRFMLITRVIGLYSSFTSLPTEHLPADRKSHTVPAA